MSTARNVNQVPKKQWQKWSTDAHRVFNDVYRFMLNNPEIVMHPAMPNPKPYHWKTVAWNAAWIAADATDDSVPTEVIDVGSRGQHLARRKVA